MRMWVLWAARIKSREGAWCSGSWGALGGFFVLCVPCSKEDTPQRSLHEQTQGLKRPITLHY
jgi:hypothetical protein